MLSEPPWSALFLSLIGHSKEAAVHLSNWLRTLQLPQLTGGLLTNVKQISVWFGLGPICLGFASSVNFTLQNKTFLSNC